jgi:acetoin utilization deacetylase AcuC-like enzyme
MAAMRLVYSEGYDLNLGRHVFPSSKYRWLHDRMRAEGFAGEADFVAPEPAPGDDLRLVHDAGWVARLCSGTLSYQEILRLEIPYSRQMVEAARLAAGGTTLAARIALAEGLGFNLGGGFHHGFAAHGEGFCALNDVAVAARVMQREGLARRVMIADCDVHHGNGTAAIFAGDPSVFTLSIHQLRNYPEEKPPSDVDIHLADGVGDAEYLQLLADAFRASLSLFQPDLLIYLAGADPYQDDQLGGLSMTFEGLAERDRFVMATAREHRIPVAVTLAGGYANRVEDTLAIHLATARVAREIAAPR